MGRTLKRVALDFNWPMRERWHGYVNPFYSQQKDCPFCGGGGYAPEAKKMHEMWYGNAPFKPEDRGSTPFTSKTPAIRALAERNCGRSPEYYGKSEWAIEKEATRLSDYFNTQWSHHLSQEDVDALVAECRLYDFTHIWTQGTGWAEKDPPYHPKAQEVNEWSLTSMGHDSINCGCVIRAECKRLGHNDECLYCKGRGTVWYTKEAKKNSENWEMIEPPAGDGYQLWETTSEGSPTSPVFKTLDELCAWCADYATTFADHKASAEEWKGMLGTDNVHHQEGNMIFI